MGWIGRQLGPNSRYRVVRRLSTGDLGRALKAIDSHEGGRRVVLKQLRRGLLKDAQALERLDGEIERQMVLRHPGLAPYQAHFGQGDRHYVERSFAQGVSLSAIIEASAGGMLPHWALEIFEMVLAAMAVAHGAGIAHLGLTPNNVYVLPEATDSAPRIVDLGVARILGQDDFAKRHKHSPYMAPEQTFGGSVDQRADIYALGALLRAMLTGKQPQSANDRQPAPPIVRAPLPEPVYHLVRRAMSSDPIRRFADAGAMLEAFRKALVGQPHLTEPKADMETPVPRLPRTTTRRTWTGHPEIDLAADLVSPTAVISSQSYTPVGGTLTASTVEHTVSSAPLSVTSMRRSAARAGALAAAGLMLLMAIVALAARAWDSPAVAGAASQRGSLAAAPGEHPVPEPAALAAPAVPGAHTATSAPGAAAASPDPLAFPPADPRRQVLATASTDDIAALSEGVHFEHALWQAGNRWVFRHSIDTPDPADTRDYLLSREIVETASHPWGTRVSIRDEGGTEAPRHRDFVASASCLIEPDTGLIHFCLPPDTDAWETRSVAGQPVRAFRTVSQNAALVFDPGVGWVEQSVPDAEGRLARTQLIGYRIGDHAVGESERAVPTCAWSATYERGRPIGRTDRPAGLSRDLQQAVDWGLEGRLRRLDIPVDTATRWHTLTVFHGRHETAYQLAGANPPDPEDGGVERLDLALDRVTLFRHPSGSRHWVMSFRRHDRGVVRVLTLDPQGEAHWSDALSAQGVPDGAPLVHMAADPDGCSLDVFSYDSGAAEFERLSLSPTGI